MDGWIDSPPPELHELRRRLEALSRRRERMAERLTPLGDHASLVQLEAMRFELAEAEWRLVELEASA